MGNSLDINHKRLPGIVEGISLSRDSNAGIDDTVEKGLFLFYGGLESRIIFYFRNL